MSNSKTIKDMIDSLIACDNQPSEERLGELRKALQLKVGDMKKKGEVMQRFMARGLAVLLLGIVLCLVAYDFFPQAGWLSSTGFGLVVAGVATVGIGAVIRARYLGVDYIWARHDLHDAVILDLSLQVQELAQRIDSLDKQNSLTS